MIKEAIARSPLHKTALKIQDKLQRYNLSDVNDRIKNHRTVYVISPYKTATRYLAACYDESISAHEPMHFTSLKGLVEDFDSFFIRRLNTLNLKLECSGFFSAYVEKLASHPLGKDLHYICVLRKPSSWITSAINNWIILEKIGYGYNYTNELFWKEIVGVDLSRFLNQSSELQEKNINRMKKYYMSYLRNTKLLRNVHYIDITELDNILPILDSLIDEKASPKKERIASNKSKKIFFYEDQNVDAEYDIVIEELQ